MAEGDGTGGLGNLSEEAAKEIVEQLRQSREIESEVAALQEQKLKWAKLTSAEMAKQVTQQRNILEELDKQTKSLIEADQINDKAFDNLNATLDKLGGVNEELRKQILLEIDIGRQKLANAGTDKDRLIIQKELVNDFAVLNDRIRLASAQTENLEQFTKKVEQGAKGIATQLGIAANVTQTKFGGAMTFVNDMMTGMSGAKAKAMIGAFKEMANPLNLAASVFDKMIENAIALDKVTVAFQRATGFAGDFRTQINDVYAATVRSGVSLEEAGQNMQALAENFSAFNPNAKAVNAEMAKTVSLLTKVGVSASESAKMMDIFNRNLGMSEKASANLTRELTRAGVSIGITSKKMASDFASNFSSIASFGNEAIDMFKDMAVQSKLTGVAMGELIAVGSKFDTFQGAAEISGRLNSVLGTQFSALEMVNLNYAERVEALRAEISTVAGGFNEMDRYTQMSIAQIGFGGDVAKAQKILNMSRGEYLEQERKMAASAETQKQLAEVTESMVPVMERLQLAFAQFAANEVVVDLLNATSFVIEGVTSAVNKLHDATGTFGTGLLVLIGSYAAYTAALSINTAAKAANTSATVAAGTAGAAAAPGMAAMGTGLAALGAGMPGALVLLAVGAAIALISGGIAAVVFSMGSLLELLVENIGTLPGLVTGLYQVTTAIMSIGGAAIGAAVGVGLMAMAMAGLAVMGIGGALFGGGMGSLEAYASAYERIGNGVKAFAEGITSVTAATTKVGSGFLAASVEGGKTSVVMSGDAGVLTNITSDKLTVDVSIPEIPTPQPIVNVFINGDQFNVDQVVTEMLAGV